MNTKEITRLAIYVLAAVAGGVIAVLAYIKGDLATMTVALGWIATNVLSAWNTPSPELQIARGDHAAE